MREYKHRKTQHVQSLDDLKKSLIGTNSSTFKRGLIVKLLNLIYSLSSLQIKNFISLLVPSSYIHKSDGNQEYPEDVTYVRFKNREDVGIVKTYFERVFVTQDLTVDFNHRVDYRSRYTDRISTDDPDSNPRVELVVLTGREEEEYWESFTRYDLHLTRPTETAIQDFIPVHPSRSLHIPIHTTFEDPDGGVGVEAVASAREGRKRKRRLPVHTTFDGSDDEEVIDGAGGVVQSNEMVENGVRKRRKPRHRG